MPAKAKVSAWLGVGLAVLFYLFFQVSKQQPELASVNAFANDPYDAVGSFAVQFALFVAVLSLIRALRRYSPSAAIEPQKRLLARGLVLTWLTVSITLVADTVAMLRHLSLWSGQLSGYVLAALLGAMALCTSLVAWRVGTWSCTLSPAPRQMPLIPALVIFAASVVILAIYPEAFRDTTHGALLTVVAGAILLLLPLSALGLAFTSSPGSNYEDIIDDLASMYHYLQRRSKRFAEVSNLIESILGWPPFLTLIRWLNPRRHQWSAAILAGLVLGTLLVLGEVLGEGGGPHQIGRLAFVVAVFVSLEMFAVLLGYALLARPLGLFRRV
jgi:hypothetical protein